MSLNAFRVTKKKLPDWESNDQEKIEVGVVFVLKTNRKKSTFSIERY